ncbi:hypothetical protein EH233_18655 [Anabaena sp. YBS01]|nr:hypothetical protein EH233_18655 [Anabaena sp. YBS01]
MTIAVGRAPSRGWFDVLDDWLKRDRLIGDWGLGIGDWGLGDSKSSLLSTHDSPFITFCQS